MNNRLKSYSINIGATVVYALLTLPLRQELLIAMIIVISIGINIILAASLN